MTAWSIGLRARWWAALNYAGGAGVIVLGASGGATHGTERVVLIACAAGVGVVQLLAQQRRERSTTRVAEDTRTITNNAISNAFTPMLGLVAELVGTTGAAEQERIRGLIRVSAAYAASFAIGPEQGVRACVFDVDDAEHPTQLAWSRIHAGRGDEPRSTFVAGTVRGDTALAMISTDTFQFCRDTLAAPPPGWHEGHQHEYRTFLAVPIRAGGRALGMLTVDSLTAGDLEPDRDRPILDVLAHILAVSATRPGTAPGIIDSPGSEDT
jgi:GAF domain-containing protein